MALYVLSYQVKSNIKLFLVQNLSDALFVLQFYLLGGMSASLCTIVCIIRNLILMKMNDCAWARWKGWTFIFTVIFAIAVAITWGGPISIFPFIACLANTFAYWTNNARTIRVISAVITAPAWLIHDVYLLALGGIITDVLTIGSVAISIYRFGWKNLGSDEFQS